LCGTDSGYGRRQNDRMLPTPPSACGVIGTQIAISPGSDPAVIRAYTAPAPAEGGCRLLKAPLVVVSAFLVKKPCRMQGLFMVMTGALWVSSVAQRRRRQPLAHHNETLPNQSTQPTARPTFRWVFPRLAGIHRVRVTVPGTVHDLSEGLNKVQITILRLCGEDVCRLYTSRGTR
jgi:hypothetical protein